MVKRLVEWSFYMDGYAGSEYITLHAEWVESECDWHSDMSERTEVLVDSDDETRAWELWRSR